MTVLTSIILGGFILQGKVYENRMIDLGITNSKLFDRACGIISQFGKVDNKTARINLLRAIYSIEQNSVPPEIDIAPVYQHIDAAHSSMLYKLHATQQPLCTAVRTIRPIREVTHALFFFCQFSSG